MTAENRMIELARTRAAMYRFLGGLYIMEVDREQLERLKELTFPEVEGEGAADLDLREGYALMHGDIARIAAEFGAKDAANADPAAEAEGNAFVGQADALNDLAADYAKTFLAAGDAAGRAAFPYESVYVDKRRRVGGSTEMQMRALYLERGLTADPAAFRVPDDHIGLILEYQACLCEEMAAALEAHDAEKAAGLAAEQRDLLKKHLMNWALSFTADVIRCAERDFYKGVAKITGGFLKKESELLSELAEKGAGAWDIA